MAKIGLIKFLQEVKNESKKITWPTRAETMTSTIAVFVMVFLIAVFLYFADQLIAYLIRTIMGF